MMAILFEFLRYVYLLYPKKKKKCSKAQNILKQDIIMYFSLFILFSQIQSRSSIPRALDQIYEYIYNTCFPNNHSAREKVMGLFELVNFQKIAQIEVFVFYTCSAMLIKLQNILLKAPRNLVFCCRSIPLCFECSQRLH